MAYAAILSLAQTTGKIILDQDKYPISQKKKQQLRSIYESFKFLQEFLDDYPEKGDKLAAGIRDAAHEAEDIIESFILDEAPSSWSSKFKFKRQMRKLRVEIDSIVEEVKVMMKNKSSKVKDEGGSSVASSPSRLAPTNKIDYVIGLNEDLVEIKGRLCGESPDLQVIPIVGMGGIGKTTLAKHAYDDPLTMQQFDIRAWVTVSQDYSADVIFSGLLASMEDLYTEGSEWSAEALPQEKVFKILKGRRYLIVMDDIWSIDAWDELTNTLPDDGNGSRIMLTTRITDVATYADRASPPHEVGLMDEGHSWNLLKEKVFANQDCPLELEDIGKEIARSCKGLPLAIVVVAGLLSNVGGDPDSWREIADNVNSVAMEGQFEKILSLSYTHLPHYLRPCFLYMGIFPEDHEIRASELIKLWVAEGFMRRSKGSQRFEDEAEECLEDLVKRNLVLVTKRKSGGGIKSCSLHDLMRDLCIIKALEEKFLVNFGSRHVANLKMRKHQRRVSLTPSGLHYLAMINNSKIRTVLCFQGSNVAHLLERFRLLRVLDAGNSRVTFLPVELFDLFHLVYLAIFHFGRIPAVISKLQNLQSLNLLGRRQWRPSDAPPVCLPHEIWSMPRLRHLFFHGWFPDPQGRTPSALENLQTLSMRPHGKSSARILRMIPNLRKLELICYDVCLDEVFLGSLMHLRQLKNLKFRSSFSNAFRPFAFPTALTKLTLSCVPLPWEDMTIVGSLPNLRVLKLKQRACTGRTWTTAEEEFPQLEFLLIEKSGLEEWITESSHFPRLKCLVLVECWLLIEIPEGIGEVPTLELIEVKGKAKKSLVESAERILEEQRECGNDAFHVRCMTHR